MYAVCGSIKKITGNGVRFTYHMPYAKVTNAPKLATNLAKYQPCAYVNLCGQGKRIF